MVTQALEISQLLLVFTHYTSFSLEPPEIVPFTFGDVAINQGDFGQLLCTIRRGDEPLTITWSLKGAKLNSGPDVMTTMLGTRTSMLTIASVSYHHIGEYTCRATNPAGSRTFSTELRVNGNPQVIKRH